MSCIAATRFGVVVYAFEGVGVLIPLKKAMVEPKQFFPTLSGAYGMRGAWRTPIADD